VLTLQEAMQLAWCEATPDEPGAVLLWRGLRVRIGMSSGVHERDMQVRICC
jgi:hypothetical protein